MHRCDHWNEIQSQNVAVSGTEEWLKSIQSKYKEVALFARYLPNVKQQQTGHKWVLYPIRARKRKNAKLSEVKVVKKLKHSQEPSYAKRRISIIFAFTDNSYRINELGRIWDHIRTDRLKTIHWFRHKTDKTILKRNTLIMSVLTTCSLINWKLPRPIGCNSQRLLSRFARISGAYISDTRSNRRWAMTD